MVSRQRILQLSWPRASCWLWSAPWPRTIQHSVPAA